MRNQTPDSKGFPTRSSTAAVCEGLLVKADYRHWSWDPEKAHEQNRKNAALNRKAKNAKNLWADLL